MEQKYYTYKNEFGDKIVSQGGFLDKKKYTSVYSIIYNGKYIKSVRGLKVGKAFINKNRGVKCKWIGSDE